MSQPKLLLHLDGLALAVMATGLFAWHGGNGWLFALLLLAPDLSALGYVLGPKPGATLYNLFHAYLLPAALAAVGLVAGSALAIHLALIWFAHIGLDRALGYGLKYPSAFKDTHLGRL